MFAWRLNTNAGLGALVSSKVNQWTLLVGTLPIVFAISSGSLHGLPLDALQREELFVTAAQSAFAVAVLANRSISVREARLLLGLFIVQFATTGGASRRLRGRGAHHLPGSSTSCSPRGSSVRRAQASSRPWCATACCTPYSELVGNPGRVSEPDATPAAERAARDRPHRAAARRRRRSRRDRARLARSSRW